MRTGSASLAHSSDDFQSISYPVFFLTKCSLNKKQKHFSFANNGSQVTSLGVHIYPQDPEYCLSFLSLADWRKVLSKREMSILKINDKT